MEEIQKVRERLLLEIEQQKNPQEVLKDQGLKKLYGLIKTIDPSERASLGQKINALKNEIVEAINKKVEAEKNQAVETLDVTAPFDANIDFNFKPRFLTANKGSIHPLSKEIKNIKNIFSHMGFKSIESRQIDDEFHMFESLNFPKNHPARDGYDTFRTKEGLIAPAHTSTMQYRILTEGKRQLEELGYIATVSIGRVFRNEDVDATHEHTFYQYEGVYVAKNASMAELLGTLKQFFEVYYGQSLKIKTQPAYFPFVEPGFEFAIEKPASLNGKPGEWLEMLGCGMVHPNVLKTAGIDPNEYSGFAWGGGIERLVMLKYGIDDLRYIESGNLNFLKEF